MKVTSQHFKAGDRFKLFLVCAFPLHVWTILMALRDVSWVAERTTPWDSLGFSAYALLYTLAESLLLFVFILLLSLLIPKNWPITLRFTALSLLAFALAGWSIIEQLILVLGYDSLVRWLSPLTFLHHSPGIGQAITALIVAVSVAVPLLLLRRYEKMQNGFFALLDRLTMLSGLYLFLDLLAIFLIVYRNL